MRGAIGRGGTRTGGDGDGLSRGYRCEGRRACRGGKNFWQFRHGNAPLPERLRLLLEHLGLLLQERHLLAEESDQRIHHLTLDWSASAFRLRHASAPAVRLGKGKP